MLLRARKLLPLFSAALTRAGVPNRVIGLGGLLSAPEVVDLRCAMRVAHDSTAGNELIRLLVGAKFQFGLADVKAIHDVSRSLANRDVTMESLADEVRASKRELATGDDEVPLQEALDFLAARIDAGKRGAGKKRDEPDTWLTGLSVEALRRIPHVSNLIGELRRNVGLPITNFVDATISIMGLDLEVTANPGNIARIGNLDAFAEAAAAFASAEPDAGLGAFLDWVEIAAGDDSLAPVQEQAEPGVVQLLSIHGSKGLEWDFVAVSRSVEGEMPSTSRDGLGWIRRGVIPYELLLDAHDRPELPWRGAETQKELADLMLELKEQIKERNDAEERRLAYVAYTRARHELLISGSYWSAIHKSARKVSAFVDELAAAGIIDVPPENTLESAPASLAADSVAWPHRPFSQARLERVEELAAAVERARRDGALPAGSLEKRIDLLLRERAERGVVGGIQLPARFAASKFKDLVTDPAEIAAQLRRPMPQKPFRQTRIGTMFHAWVEAHYAAPTVGGDLLGMAELFGTEDSELSGLADASSADFTELERLQDAFLDTPWPHRTPILVEQTIEFRLGERTVVCKIDAVFEHNGRVEVVDWKTGRVPSGESARWERQLQLALYTLAYSEHTGVPRNRSTPSSSTSERARRSGFRRSPGASSLSVSSRRLKRRSALRVRPHEVVRRGVVVEVVLRRVIDVDVRAVVWVHASRGSGGGLVHKPWKHCASRVVRVRLVRGSPACRLLEELLHLGDVQHGQGLVDERLCRRAVDAVDERVEHPLGIRDDLRVARLHAVQQPASELELGVEQRSLPQLPVDGSRGFVGVLVEDAPRDRAIQGRDPVEVAGRVTDTEVTPAEDPLTWLPSVMIEASPRAPWMTVGWNCHSESSSTAADQRRSSVTGSRPVSLARAMV